MLIMLNVVMLNVVMLSVVMLSVVAPSQITGAEGFTAQASNNIIVVVFAK
jgi:hypothetical protein